MNTPNVERLSPFDAEDERTAKQLEITLPDLWITDRYDARLRLADTSLQIDPDALIAAYDRLGIQVPCNFGVIFDSLDHDAGPETDCIYRVPDTFERAVETTPVFTLLADPTPTTGEHSAELTDFGLLIGSRVMADIIDAERADDLRTEKKKRGERITAGGVIAQFTTTVGNIAANSAHLYNALPYIGSGAGLIVVGSGLAARIGSIVQSRHLKEQQLCVFAEDMVEDSVLAVSKTAGIVTFAENIGGSESTRRVLRSIYDELDRIDPSVDQDL